MARQVPGPGSVSILAAAAALLCSAASAEPAAPALSEDPAVNCPIYAAVLGDRLFGLQVMRGRVLNHASRRPADLPPNTPLPTSAMAARSDAPWNEPAETWRLLLTGPDRKGFLPITCQWRRLGVNAEPTSLERGTRYTLSLPVLTADRTHALVYVQVYAGMVHTGRMIEWNSYVCAAARDPQGWRSQGCLHHADTIFF